MSSVPAVAVSARITPPTSNSFTRTMKFAVFFKDKERKELEGKTGLWYQLARARGEITRAANQTVSALYQVKWGHLSLPVKVDGKPIPLETAAWAPFRQRDPWHPFGEARPLYRPERRLSGGNLAELGGIIYSRLQTDFKKVRAGQQSLSTFQDLPLPLRAASILVEEDEKGVYLQISLWEGRGDKLLLAPILTHREHGQRETFRKLLTGEAKHGSGTLYKDDRSGKWMMSLSWTGDVAVRNTGKLIAGINLGMVTTASIAYLDAATGTIARVRDRINISTTTVTAWKRVDAARAERLKYGRVAFDAQGRAGRGVTRKIRAVAVLSGKRDRLVTEAVRQTANAIVKAVLKRGARLLVLEDLSWSVEAKMDETAELTNAQRAAVRKNFLLWQQGALRAQLQQVSEREGLPVLVVPARHDSNTCAVCGNVYPRPPKVPGQLRQPYCIGFGRIAWGKFKCECGNEDHADHNAGAVVAKRGWVVDRGAVTTGTAVPGKGE